MSCASSFLASRFEWTAGCSRPRVSRRYGRGKARVSPSGVDERGRFRVREAQLEPCRPAAPARRRDGAAHALRELLHDREPQAGPDRALEAVAGMQVEALEGMRELLGLQSGAGVLDREEAGLGD